MDTFLSLCTLVLGYLSFMVLSWLSHHVRMSEEGYQVRWCGGQALYSPFLRLRGSRISLETLNNSSPRVCAGKELGYWKHGDGFDTCGRFLLNVFDKSGDEDQGGRRVTRRVGGQGQAHWLTLGCPGLCALKQSLWRTE